MCADRPTRFACAAEDTGVDGRSLEMPHEKQSIRVRFIDFVLVAAASEAFAIRMHSRQMKLFAAVSDIARMEFNAFAFLLFR